MTKPTGTESAETEPVETESTESGKSGGTGDRVTVTVNGEDREVPPGYALTDLLADLEIEPESTAGVAVAINRSVIRRQDWGGATLASGDTVEVIQAQQGG